MAADILTWRLWRPQVVAMNVYIGPQLEKSRTGVSINSMARLSSGWALQRILVFLYFLCYRRSTKWRCMILAKCCKAVVRWWQYFTKPSCLANVKQFVVKIRIREIDITAESSIDDLAM